MAEIKNIDRDSKFIKLMADRVNGKRIETDKVEEADQIIGELVTDLNPAKRHLIAQTIAYTVDELQKNELDFLNLVADRKAINYGDKAAFKVQTEGVKAYIQAKGATTARSYVADRQVLLSTEEISARPAINIVDLRTGRVNMADVIRMANKEITNKKIEKVQTVLQAAIANYTSPFYATGSGVNKPALDAMLQYFRRLGPVTIIGDSAAVGAMSNLAGMAFTAGENMMHRSPEMLNEMNDNGFIGRYNGCNVVAMNNAYHTGTTDPILAADWLYILPAGATGDARNLKIVEEGAVMATENQDINDMVFETRLDSWFGVGFVAGKQPTIGAYNIN